MASTGRGTPSGMRLFNTVIEEPDMREMIKQISDNTADQVHAILRFAASDLLYFLKGYTNVMRPPRYQRKFMLDKLSRRVAVPKGMGWRPAHPGGWADVEGQMRDAYWAKVEADGNSFRLVVGNKDPDAVYVEAMHGYFVIHGILESRGPVQRSIMRAIDALGLKGSWRVAGMAGSAVNDGQDILAADPVGAQPMPTGIAGYSTP